MKARNRFTLYLLFIPLLHNYESHIHLNKCSHIFMQPCFASLIICTKYITGLLLPVTYPPSRGSSLNWLQAWISLRAHHIGFDA
ncbi:hypothetical protein BDP81DRAFT_414395 [Colletotrichum phormii]|uniref:Uncharacterized protein n=1 Tax=Colletotrichum phormii TaxID=359342 RepID=A0AAJ0EP35_9PEZI|nr:uncharacterized protein BDP81DRAFT_414395 [Colletotrichum phormii]KAK1656209.1 hypothetical protein BDP81DRAFT_414395 [Colletotrichum phormii]